MDTRYETLLDELHTNKRELAAYRQKYLNIQNQNLSIQEENRTLKKTIHSLKDQIQKLNGQNKFLASEKETIVNDYSTSIQSIKQQISKKQQQIFTLKQNSYSPLLNQKLFQRQLRCEIERDFEQIVSKKEGKVQQLQKQIDRMNFDKQVGQQKFQLKISSLQKQLKEMQNSHLIQLQNYANRTYQNSQNQKITEEQLLIKKLRRQIDQLRITLDQVTQELNESVAEKAKIQKEYSIFIVNHKKQSQKNAEELRIYQQENQKLTEATNRNKPEREQLILREKDKQIKKLRQTIEELHQAINKKDKKVSEQEIDIIQAKAQIKKVKQFSSKHQTDRVAELRIQKQSLQREINELKFNNENIRKHNMELLHSFTEIQSKSSKNIQDNAIKHFQQNVLNASKQKDKVHRRQLSIQDHQRHNGQQSYNNFELQNSFGDKNIPPESMKDQALQNQKKYYQSKLNEEIIRNRELGQKYVELKKKFNNLEHKFKEANDKVVELLKHKIQLGSPTAASKKSFDFPTSPDQQRYFGSPPSKLQNINLSKTQANLNSLLRNAIRSPMDSNKLNVNTMKRTDKSSQSQKEGRSFYQKSLKIKNTHKFKQLKCLNHDDPQFNHENCDHSPIKSYN